MSVGGGLNVADLAFLVMWEKMKWCRHQDLNSGPTDYKSVALPAELYRHWIYQGVEFYVLWAASAMFLDVKITPGSFRIRSGP